MPCQACQFYVASLWLLPAQFNVLMPSTSLNPSQVSAILKQVSYASGAEVVFKGMCFEMHGLEHEVRAAVTMLLDLDIVKVRNASVGWPGSPNASPYSRTTMRFASKSN